MSRRVIPHFPCDQANPYNRLIVEGIRSLGIETEMRPYAFHTNPWRALAWAKNHEIAHWHWRQGFFPWPEAPRSCLEKSVGRLNRMSMKIRGVHFLKGENELGWVCGMPGRRRTSLGMQDALILVSRSRKVFIITGGLHNFIKRSFSVAKTT